MGIGFGFGFEVDIGLLRFDRVVLRIGTSSGSAVEMNKI